MNATWYDELREQYRPELVRLLLIGESPPDPGSGNRRFFYSPTLTHDNLYRGVAQALYGDETGFDARDKPKVLGRLRDDGVWLIDAVDDPIDKQSQSVRKAAIRGGIQELVGKCSDLRPELGVISCHGVVYQIVAESLRSAGIRVLHEEPLPFPLGNHRARFIAGFRAALYGVSTANVSHSAESPDS